MGRLVAVVLGLALGADPARLTLEGTVADAAGRPVAAARVDISTAAPRVGRGIFCPSCYLDCAKWTRSDEQGRFVITGLDSSLLFRIICTSPGKETHLTPLVDPLKGPLAIALADLPSDIPAERIVLGAVVDADGAPIPGALIEPVGAKTAEMRWGGRVEGARPTASDEAGRFVMPLAEGYLGVDVEVNADGFAGALVELLAPGTEEHRIVVPAGTRVTGRLAHGGRPVAGLGVAVVQADRRSGRLFIKAIGDETDDEGRFEFTCLPSREPYVIFTPVGAGDAPFVLATKRFMAAGDGETRDLGMLELIAGLRLAGRVELPQGESLPSEAKLVLQRDPAWDLISFPLDADGRFDIASLPPETYGVRIAADGYQIDPAGLSYQLLGPQELGLRLKASVDDLLLPLKPSEPPASP